MQNSFSQNDQDEMLEMLAGANSIRGALFKVKNDFPILAECDIAYELLPWAKSYIRSDLVAISSLPNEMIELYFPSGGTNTDPVIDKAGKQAGLFTVDIAGAIAAGKTRYTGNPFFAALLDRNCTSLGAYFLTGSAYIGYPIFTIFESPSMVANRPAVNDILALAGSFHFAIRELGLMARHLKVTELEQVVLLDTARGRTAEDLSAEYGVSQRTVELRLQSVRKKLRARNTAEAAFKGLIYGVVGTD